MLGNNRKPPLVKVQKGKIGTKGLVVKPPPQAHATPQRKPKLPPLNQPRVACQPKKHSENALDELEEMDEMLSGPVNFFVDDGRLPEPKCSNTKYNISVPPPEEMM